MEPVIVTLPDFQVVGVSFSANLTEIEEDQLAKKAYDELLSRKGEVADKIGDEVYLVQIYPDKPELNPRVDAFTLILGYKVTNEAIVPRGMVKHTVPANDYVTYTHKGPESELGSTYDYLCGQWLPRSGRHFAGYDFEIWDDRYKPTSPENEIDVHMALRSCK